MKSFYYRGMLAAATVLTLGGVSYAQEAAPADTLRLAAGQDNKTVFSLASVQLNWEDEVVPDVEREFQLMTVGKQAVATGKFKPVDAPTNMTFMEFNDFQGDFTATTPGRYQLQLASGAVYNAEGTATNAGAFVFLEIEDSGSENPENPAEYTSMTPAPGNVTELSQIDVEWAGEYGVGQVNPYIVDANGVTVSTCTLVDYDWDNYNILKFYFTPSVVADGEYTVIFPAGSLLDANGDTLGGLEVNYTIGATSGYAYTFKSVNPEDGSQVESLRGLTTYWDGTTEETVAGASVVVKNEAGEEVSKGDLAFDFEDDTKYTVSFNPAIKEAGSYTVVIPEGALVDGSKVNEPVELHYTIASAEPVITFDLEPSSVTPVNGDILREKDGRQFRINLGFNDPFVVKEGFEFMLTDSVGVTYPLEYTNFAAMNTLILNFPKDTYIPENTYKLIIPAGTIGNQDWADSGYTAGHANPELTYEWTWVPVPAVVVIPDDVLKADLEIKSAVMDGVDLLAEGATVAAWKNGTDLAISTNKDEWAHYLALNIVDDKTGESVYTISTFENIGPNGEVQDNGQQDENGVFHFIKTRDLEFTEGCTYTIQVTAYQDLMVADKVELGNAEIKFGGATPAWVYSDVDIEDINKDPDTYEFDNINDRSIVITYSAPVEIVTSADGVSMYTSISHGMDGMYDFESITPNEDKTVWTFTLPEYELTSAMGGIVINIVANDMKGLRVYPKYYDYNIGIEENAHQQYDYSCYLGCAVIECDPASESVVDSLYNFSFTCPTAAGKNISFMGMGDKEAANGILYRIENGERAEEVARIDRNDYVEIDNGAATDTKVLEVRMHLDKVVSEEGEYELYLQPGFLMTGTEYDAICNRNTSYFYTIKTTGVDEVLGDGVEVKVVEGGIAVSGAAEVYTISGVKVASVDGEATVALEKGIYVVVANGKAIKVAL